MTVLTQTRTDETPTAAVQRVRRRSGRRRTAVRKALLGTVGTLALLVVWELAPLVGLVDARFFPRATAVLGAFFALLGQPEFWGSVGVTMLTWLIGLVIAVAAAGILGFIVGSSGFLRRATRSTIEFFRPIPSVALIPIAVLLFGIKLQAGVMLIAYACFWQVFVQVLYGIADIDPVARATTQVYRFGFLGRTRHLVLPTALPYLLTGVRLAATVALVLAITTQMIIGSPGLGADIVVAQSGNNMSKLFALVVATGVIGMLVNLAARRFERRVLHWHSSVRSELLA